MRIGDICSNNLPSVATIGFFDGVHRGHRFLIGQVRREAAARGLDAAVITFPVHPRQVLQCDYRPQLLTTPQEKLSLLAETGIDTCILLDFLPELRKRYKVCLLSNTNAIHWNYACTHDFARGGRRVEDYFDHIYLSYRMKMIKPDAEIFQAVLDDTRWVPQETLFIDDAEANCRTAQSLGIRTYTPQAHEDWRHLFQ